MGLPVVRTGNVALDRFLESVREYIETSKGNGNVNSVDRVLRVSDLASIVQLSAASAAVKAKELTQSDVEKLAMDLSNTRLFKSLTSSGSALDGVVDGLPREVLADVRANANNSLSAVTSEAIVSTTDTQAVAAQVTTVSATLTGLAGDVATVETAYLALASDVGGLEAQYTIKVRAGGAIAGIGVAASDPGEGGATSSVIISADKFAVVASGASSTAGAKVPFTINTGTNKINFTSDVEIDGDLLVRSTGLNGVGGQFASIIGDNGATSVGATGVYGYSRYGVYGFSSFTGSSTDFDHAGVMAVNAGTGNAIWMKGWLRWTNNATAFDCRIEPPAGSTTTFLRNDGTWATPASGSVPWASVTGKPTTFPPDSHTHDYAASSHTHSGYATTSYVDTSISNNNTAAVAAVQSYYASGRTITIPGVGSWSGCSIT